MEMVALLVVSLVITVIICVRHFKLGNYATFGINILLVIGIIALCHRAISGLIAGMIASAIISIYFLLRLLKSLDKEFKNY
jgi:CHASE2 domain-containing sensor protein